MRCWAILLLTTAFLPLGAESRVEPVNRDSRGVALKGYDAVAYFEQGKPVKGSPEHAYEWNGAKWWFSSVRHRDLFAAAPKRYAPQYGGYCAWTVGHGRTADADPEAWKIVDGKLYLTNNPGVRKKWEEYFPKLIEEGNRNWAALRR